MLNLFKDITAAINLTCETWKEREEGYNVSVEKVYRIPIIHTGYWSWTPESSLFYGEKWKPVRDVFKTFPEETQHALTLAPKDDGWASRVELWEEPLREALPPDMYLEAMAILCDWVLRCMKRRAAKVELDELSVGD